MSDRILRQDCDKSGVKYDEDHNIFISYRRSGGSGMAMLIYEHLCREGYHPYLDVHEMHGGKFDEQIYDKIDKVSDVIVVLSRGATDWHVDGDDWLRNEVAYAIKQKKHIIPVMLPEYSLPANIDDEPEDVRDLYRYNGVPVVWKDIEHVKSMLVSYLRAKPDSRVWGKVLVTLGILAACVLIYVVGDIIKTSMEHDNILLVGSGTVGTCLRNNKEISRDDKICVFDAASYEAFKMLPEIKNSSRGRLYVLVMSAARVRFSEKEDADDDRLKNLRKVLKDEKLKMVEVKLNERDNLQVVLKPADAFIKYVDSYYKEMTDGASGTITIDKLAELIREFQADKAAKGNRSNCFIYRTSENSGTLEMFNKHLPADAKVNCELSKQFRTESASREGLKINDYSSKVMFLCGRMYCPSKDVYFADGGRKYNVVDGDGKQIEKELFLYFLINEGDKTVPSAMKALLRKVGREKVVERIGKDGNLDHNSLLIYEDRGDMDAASGN